MRKIPAILFLILLALSGAAAEFKFAVLGESRFQNPETFEEMVGEAALLKPDFVIHVGNMIHGYTYDPERIRQEWDRFKTQISPLAGIPFYPIPGNHDVATPAQEQIYKKIWGRDKLYYSFDYRGSHFILLNTEYKYTKAGISKEQLLWLEAELEKNCGAENIFVFMHRPLWRYEDSNWRELHEILSRQKNLKTLFAGHSREHCFEEVQGIRCFIVNSSGRMNHAAPAVGYFHQFLYVSVRGEKVTEAVVPAGSIKPPDYVTRRERERATPFFPPPAGGQIPDTRRKPLDHIYSFPLENRTSEMNVYTVRWEIPNPAFTVEPLEQAVLIPPGRSEDVFVRIRAPERNYRFYSLPYAFIETYYNTFRGESVVLRSRHDLSIPRRTGAGFAPRPPWVDGLLDDTAWQSARIATDFQVNKVGDLAGVQTWVRTLYDEENLYVGIHCEEPHPEHLVVLAVKEAPYIWGDDDVELFLDVNHDMRTFARMFVNSRGITFNSMPEKGMVEEWYDHAGHVGKDYWSVEFRLPFRNLGVEDTPTSSTVWGFNVRRHRQKPVRVQSDWVKMQNYPYEPWRFGVLRFEE